MTSQGRMWECLPSFSVGYSVGLTRGVSLLPPLVCSAVGSIFCSPVGSIVDLDRRIVRRPDPRNWYRPSDHRRSSPEDPPGLSAPQFRDAIGPRRSQPHSERHEPSRARSFVRRSRYGGREEERCRNRGERRQSPSPPCPRRTSRQCRSALPRSLYLLSSSSWALIIEFSLERRFSHPFAFVRAPPSSFGNPVVSKWRGGSHPFRRRRCSSSRKAHGPVSAPSFLDVVECAPSLVGLAQESAGSFQYSSSGGATAAARSDCTHLMDLLPIPKSRALHHHSLSATFFVLN